MSEGLYDRLNVYYFVDGWALNDKPRLATVAHEEIERLVAVERKDGSDDPASSEPVMTEDEILAFLKGDEGRKEIDDALQALYAMGVHGIPKFIVEGRTVVDGAARSDTFVGIFREIEERGYVLDKPVFGKILGLTDEVIENGSHSLETMSM